MNANRIIISIFFTCCSIILSAQDIHFSNTNTNVLNLNPAYTGYIRGKYRYHALYRDQYRSVAMPYQTSSLGIDFRGYEKRRNANAPYAYGLLLNYDIAGDSQLSSTQIHVPLAFHAKLNKEWMISMGISPALYFNSITYAFLRFPDQFNGTHYDPNLPIEEIPNSERVYFNMHAGAFATYLIEPHHRYNLGFAVYNLTQPNISFFDNSIPLPRRYVIHGSGKIELSRTFDIAPECKVQFQNTQKEIQLGILAIQYIENLSVYNIMAGAWYRLRDRDAIILGVGGNFNGYDVLFHYDINLLSDLEVASQGQGAFEITVTNEVFRRKKARKQQAIKCPGHL